MTSLCLQIWVWKRLKYRRDFRKLKWHYKIKHINDERLQFKLLANEWDKVKSKGRPRKCWLAHVNSLRKELDLQEQNFGEKTNERSP